MLLGIIFYFMSLSSMAQDVAVFQLPLVVQDTSIQESNRTINETNLKYSKNLLNQNFDFELNPVAQGKFSLNMLHDTKAMVSIKVYDIIGNLLYEENVKIRGSFKKEFDLSSLKTKFFIVEVGNKDFNKTKSIVVS
jgi:hypothetical protein